MDNWIDTISKLNENGKYEITVIFGEESVEAYNEGKAVNTYTTREFNTKGEVDAYCLGLADMDGWMDSYIVGVDERRPNVAEELNNEDE